MSVACLELGPLVRNRAQSHAAAHTSSSQASVPGVSLGDRSAGQEKGSRLESKERVALWCSWKFSLGEVLTEVP